MDRRRMAHGGNEHSHGEHLWVSRSVQSAAEVWHLRALVSAVDWQRSSDARLHRADAALPSRTDYRRACLIGIARRDLECADVGHHSLQRAVDLRGFADR